MEIRKTKVIGFCGGVRRAIKLAEENAGAYIAGGDIIHNPNEVERLRRDFGVVATDVNKIPSGKVAVIRAHGISKAEQKSMEDRKIKIVDATCPKVKNVQNLANEFSKEGYSVFLFGDKTHPEVLGIVGHAENVFVFSAVTELENLQLPMRIALISQTTKPIGEFQRAEKFLSEKVDDFKSVCTICPATQNNQNATTELSKWADIMIVIGGRKSSNTKTLVYSSEQFCKSVYQVENASELNHTWFIGKNRCGITAGLSTPDYIIEEVETAISNISSSK